jgi:hypothetical protein
MFISQRLWKSLVLEDVGQAFRHTWQLTHIARRQFSGIEHNDSLRLSALFLLALR